MSASGRNEIAFVAGIADAAGLIFSSILHQKDWSTGGVPRVGIQANALPLLITLEGWNSVQILLPTILDRLKHDRNN